MEADLRPATPSGGTIRWQGQPLNAASAAALPVLFFSFLRRHFLGLSVGQEI